MDGCAQTTTTRSRRRSPHTTHHLPLYLAPRTAVSCCRALRRSGFCSVPSNIHGMPAVQQTRTDPFRGQRPTTEKGYSSTRREKKKHANRNPKKHHRRGVTTINSRAQNKPKGYRKALASQQSDTNESLRKSTTQCCLNNTSPSTNFLFRNGFIFTFSRLECSSTLNRWPATMRAARPPVHWIPLALATEEDLHTFSFTNHGRGKESTEQSLVLA